MTTTSAMSASHFFLAIFYPYLATELVSDRLLPAKTSCALG